ncbi:MAG: Plasmid maintenance system killer [Hydrocarboniphaga sp.]|uniref:type II toxin-antitoxin system RelE/ParE family toxin n=1 Tax=Hydrocarboniphaga sp. TaxID=2033016 RepID=UPI002614C704|nr:type II toxin-antitoxin system RelE/ParE family toxin [Hydrocarboniphaga sp.]MDB5969346.1 Plasmid maintenance system killer [Hydrocarboniphaga sp.]
MIKSWANSATRKLAEAGKSKFTGLDQDAALELLAALDAASALSDLSPLKSVGLHKLTGDRKGQCAMTINGPWRVCFRFEDGDAWEVEIVDYH